MKKSSEDEWQCLNLNFATLTVCIFDGVNLQPYGEHRMHSNFDCLNYHSFCQINLLVRDKYPDKYHTTNTQLTSFPIAALRLPSRTYDHANHLSLNLRQEFCRFL
jgi:hypothetical protein